MSRKKVARKKKGKPRATSANDALALTMRESARAGDVGRAGILQEVQDSPLRSSSEEEVPRRSNPVIFDWDAMEPHSQAPGRPWETPKR